MIARYFPGWPETLGQQFREWLASHWLVLPDDAERCPVCAGWFSGPHVCRWQRFEGYCRDCEGAQRCDKWERCLRCGGDRMRRVRMVDGASA